MFNLFFALFLIALVCLPVAVIKPSLFRFLQKGESTRMKAGFTFLGLTILFSFLVAVTTPNTVDQSNKTKSSIISITIVPSKTSTPLQKTNLTQVKATPTTVISPTGSTTYHPPALEISGYPGLTKVLINASMSTSANGITFTNNEKDKWDGCITTINPDSGGSNWYEFDFADSILPGQAVFVRWDQLTRQDGTMYTFHAAAKGSELIQLSCELDVNTMGFARFQY